MSPIETFLFDLDGTLIDSIELILSSFRHTRRVHFGDSLPDAVYLAGIGRPLRDAIAELATDAQPIEPMIETYRTHNHAHHDAMVRPYPGIVDAVRELHASGARLAVVTSKLRVGAVKGLLHCGLAELFEVVICADDVREGKPHPEAVEKALAALDRDPATAVFVGDSPHDMEAGRRAGVRTAAALWGPFERARLEVHSPSYFLAHPSDVPALRYPGRGMDERKPG